VLTFVRSRPASSTFAPTARHLAAEAAVPRAPPAVCNLPICSQRRELPPAPPLPHTRNDGAPLALPARTMTRTWTIMSLLTLLVAGCGNGSNGNTGGNGGGSGGDGGDGSDLSAAAGSDLASTLPPDMQPAYGCHALDACLNACTDQASCGLCISSSTTAARQLYQAVTRCVRKTCYPQPDGGAAPCNQGGGTQPPACTTCQDDSLKMAGSCGADTLYCGTCYSAYAACEASLP
jgi:hypothetical protein